MVGDSGSTAGAIRPVSRLVVNVFLVVGVAGGDAAIPAQQRQVERRSDRIIAFAPPESGNPTIPAPLRAKRKVVLRAMTWYFE